MVNSSPKVNHGLMHNELGEILTVFQAYPKVEQAVLFGSRAMGTYREGSDIDLAVYGPGITPGDMLSLRANIDDLGLLHTVDLLQAEHIDNQTLLDHIHRVGVVVYKKFVPA